MVEHLGIVVLVALVAYGAHTVQQEGMILHFLTRLWIKAPSWAQKPLWTCPPCCVSFWGIPTVLIVAPDLWMYLPIHLFAAAGLAAYLNR